MQQTSSNILQVTALVGVVSLLSFLLYRLNRQRKGNTPPMVKDSFKIFLDNYTEGKHHQFQLKWSRETGSIFRLPIPQFIPTVALIVTDSGLARLILEGNTNFEELDKSFAYRGMKGVTLGVNSMVTKKTHGEGWDWSRKAMVSSFSTINLCRLLPDLQLQLNQLRQILDSHIEQEKNLEDIASWMVRLTMDFLARSMFHNDFGTMHYHSVMNGTSDALESDMDSDGHRLMLQLGVAIKEFTMMQAMIPFRKYMFWHEEVKEGLKAAKEIESIGQKILNKYRSEHSAEQLSDDKTIIGHLLRSPYPTDKERIADVTTFLVAGHDTTGYQMAWIIIEVSKHPEILQKIREELDPLIPDDMKEFTPKMLGQMHYLSMVIKEGMRLWPVLPIGSNRVCRKDFTYKEYFIPKGATLAIGNFALFRSGIREADSFIPDRWLEKDVDNVALKELFLPFSTGKRACIGQNLALLEMKLVLATLFNSYDFELTSRVEESYYLSLKPLNANFKISKRIK